VLYGFALAFLATVLAAIWQDFFGLLPPFPFWSAPVITGTVGGVLMIIGCIGLMWLKASSLVLSRDLIDDRMVSMDTAFLVVLLLASVTGILTLALRSTGAMGPMLTLHLATLVALYATAPYGKFVHGAYRFIALLKSRVDQGLDLRRAA
jgi:citrate/tricarballylate utilization protein